MSIGRNPLSMLRRLASTLHQEASKELERRAGYRELPNFMDVLHT